MTITRKFGPLLGLAALIALGLAPQSRADSPPAGENQTVTVAENRAATITLSSYDPNGEPDTYTVNTVSGPAHGSLSGTAPNLTYTPATNYLGSDSFQYQVSDSTGGSSAPATVTIAVESAPLTVTSLADSGVGTLRAAVNYANSNSGGTITFDPIIFAAKQTITLSSGFLTFSTTTTIQGPTAGVIIDGGNTAGTSVPNANAIFFVQGGTFTMTNVTLQNGYAAVEPITITQYGTYTSAKGDAGGAIAIGQSTTVKLINCALTNNRGAEGGAIYNQGLLYLTNCVLSGNSSYVDTLGFGGSGACIDNEGGFVSLTSCTFTNNNAVVYGGGLNTVDGDAALVDCTFTGNTAGYGGGGVYGNTAPLTMTNCVLTGNTAPVGGGVDCDSSSYTWIAGCTFTANSAVANANTTSAMGGGFYSGVFCVASLTNDIFYGNAAPDGADFYLHTDSSGGTGTVNVSYCDVGSFDQTLSTHVAYVDGGHNISADPMFVNAANGDLHLQTGSPCLGMGTATVPANPASTFSNQAASHTDHDGNTRPSPPSIGAYEGAAGTHTTHIAWTNTDGRLSLWNYSITDGSFTQNTYGPYANWSAKAIADGPDARTRVLWDNTDGRMSLWSLDNTTGSFTQYTFGPYAGWAAKAVSVASDDTTHVLWANTDGRLSLWNYNTNSGTFTQNTYGPYAGWTATAIADGPDGKTRVLWDNTSGAMSLWSLDNGVAASFTQFTFGPYAGWTATALSVGASNTTHVAWTNTDGRLSLWNYNTSTGNFTQNTYGPYAGWNAASIADGSDGKTRVLWDNTDGHASIWSLDNVAGQFTQNTYGPYAGWTALAVSAP